MLNEVFMLPITAPSIKEFPQRHEELMTVDTKTGKRYIDKTFENLQSRPSCTSTSENSLGTRYENRNKNRFSNILPVDDAMPQIRNKEDKLIYINTVFLPGYRSKRSFIVTQMPLRETVEDFWWLLYNQNVSTVVMLNQTENDKKADNQNIGWYWPLETKAVGFGPFRVVKESMCTANKDYTIIDLVFTTNKKNKRRIRIFKSNFWPDSATIPSSVLPLLKLIKEVELHQSKKSSSPVVVHCINGAGKSGLYCVLQFVLERLKIEHDVAIHHVIKMMRCVRPSILPNMEQFKFCHDVVMEFIKLPDVSSFLK